MFLGGQIEEQNPPKTVNLRYGFIFVYIIYRSTAGCQWRFRCSTIQIIFIITIQVVVSP